MRPNSRWCVVLLASMGAACGSSSGAPGDFDAEEPGDDASLGSERDAGSAIDGGRDTGTGSGSRPDSGTAEDGGSGEDSGAEVDSGSAQDSGSAHDSGAEVDSASAKDAGEDTGSGAGVDAGKDGGAGPDSGTTASGVHAVGNQIYDGTKAIRLLGVDRPGTEYACIQDSGIFDGPSDQASISAMLLWNVNSVRVPLNEDCWLSRNGAPALYSGATYQSAIAAYVTLLLDNGIYPILDLHWTEDAGAAATGQQPMPDVNATAFWTSVATLFKSQNKVVFDLFNEPFPDDNMDATSAWQCWENGGSTCPGVGYTVVGMQAMLTAVRNAGADNLVVLGGLEYSNDLSQWLTYEPTDPARNLAVSWHVYSNSNYTSNHTLSADAAPVLAKVPIVATEIGDGKNPPACNGTFITEVMDYLDAPGNGVPAQSYLAWSWSTDNMPSLISDYTGTPRCDGATFKAHLLAQ
jgi:endoglucanase